MLKCGGYLYEELDLSASKVQDTEANVSKIHVPILSVPFILECGEYDILIGKQHSGNICGEFL